MKLGALLAVTISCSSPSRPPPALPPIEPPKPAPPMTNDKPPAVEDPYLWLEEVTSDKSLAWARERNKQSQAELEAVPGFAQWRDRIRAILDSKEKITFVNKRGRDH